MLRIVDLAQAVRLRGWPDDLDIFKAEFVESLASFGAAFANWLANELDGAGFFVPMNEIISSHSITEILSSWKAAAW